MTAAIEDRMLIALMLAALTPQEAPPISKDGSVEASLAGDSMLMMFNVVGDLPEDIAWQLIDNWCGTAYLTLFDSLADEELAGWKEPDRAQLLAYRPAPLGRFADALLVRFRAAVDAAAPDGKHFMPATPAASKGLARALKRCRMLDKAG